MADTAVTVAIVSGGFGLAVTTIGGLFTLLGSRKPEEPEVTATDPRGSDEPLMTMAELLSRVYTEKELVENELQKERRRADRCEAERARDRGETHG